MYYNIKIQNFNFIKYILINYIYVYSKYFDYMEYIIDLSYFELLTLSTHALGINLINTKQYTLIQ